MKNSTENIQTIEELEMELLNTPDAASIEEHEANLAKTVKLKKAKKTVKEVVTESPETVATVTKPAKRAKKAPKAETLEVAPLEPIEGAFSIVFAAESFAAGLDILQNGISAVEAQPAVEATDESPAVPAVEAIEAVTPQIESCKDITEITADSAEYETLMKYGSKKWFSITETRLHELKRNSAEGFQIVGKAARRAKADLGLKGKKGLKIYFIHGINK